jgi:hypothetical protein
VGLNERGEVVVRKKFSLAQLLRFTANRKVHVIAWNPAGVRTFWPGRSKSKDTKYVCCRRSM